MTRCVLVKCPGVWSQINRGGQAVESVQTHGVASRPQAPNPLSEAAPVMTQTASGGSRPGAAGCASPRPGGDWFPGVTSLAPRRAASPSSREPRPALRDGYGAGRSCPAAAGAGPGARDMARGPGPLGRARPDTAAMPKRGKRLKFRAHDACSGRGGRGAWVSKGWAGGREGAGRVGASARLPAAGGARGQEAAFFEGCCFFQ